MAANGTWGTDTEMCVLAHLLNVVVYNFNSSGYWLPCLPHGCRSLYIYIMTMKITLIWLQIIIDDSCI